MREPVLQREGTRAEGKEDWGGGHGPLYNGNVLHYLVIAIFEKEWDQGVSPRGGGMASVCPSEGGARSLPYMGSEA